MTAALLVIAGVFVAWSLLDRVLLRRTWVTAPVFFAVAGAIALLFSPASSLSEGLNTQAGEQAAEYILALILFVDALEVRGGLLGRESRPALRLLMIGLPLTLILGVVVGSVLFPDLPLTALLVIVCAVSPTDMAPAIDMMRDERVPGRVRRTLNLESGYNDGIVAPIFAFGLAWLGTPGHAKSPAAALEDAVPATVKALVIGAAVGALAGVLLRWSADRGFTNARAERIGTLAVPIVAFTGTVLIHGNGFVSAFVCGIAFRVLRGTEATHHHAELVEDVSIVTGNLVWFVLGGLTVVVGLELLEWRTVVFALLMLSVVRIVPVLLSLLGSDFNWPERLLVGLLGPRGIATIVFGLLAYNVMELDEADVVLQLMVVTVALSLVLHGPGSQLLARIWHRTRTRRGGASSVGPTASAANE